MTPTFDLKPHTYAELFPMPPTEGPAWEEFKATIAGDRQQEPIARYQGQILDGRCRYEACRQLGQAPRFFEFSDSDRGALEYVMRRNYHRRDLTPEQRASVRLVYYDEIKRLGEEAMKAAGARGAESGKKGGRGRKKSAEKPPVENFPQGVSAGEKAPAPKSRDLAAEGTGMTGRNLQKIANIRERGAPELQAMWKSGAVSTDAAERVSRLPPSRQAAIVAKGPSAVKEYAAKQRKGGTPSASKSKGTARHTPGGGRVVVSATVTVDVWESVARGDNVIEFVRDGITYEIRRKPTA